MRKATLNASNEAPAPNTDETTMSRTRPVTRDASVKSEIVDAARSRFMGRDGVGATLVTSPPMLYSRSLPKTI